MDVRKATTPQIVQPQIEQKSEVTKTKSAGLNPIADSFEKENSQSSSVNSSSTASSEPEKKAGQITGGILIKQMTTARLGEKNVSTAKQEDTGKKELSSEQQSRVSNSDPRKKNLDSSFSLQNARSKDDDRKNSGLQAPFAPNKGPDANAKFSKVGKDQIIASLGQGSSEQTSNAVKDAGRLVGGGSLRSQVDAEVAERHQDSNAIGGSKSDRLNDLLNPSAAGPQQGSKAGKDQLAYMQESVRKNEDGTSTTVIESADEFKGDIIHSIKETTYDGTGKELEVHLAQTRLNKDNSKVISDHKRVNDDNGNVKSVVDTSTTTKSDGTVIVETNNLTVNEDGSTKEITTKETTNKDGSKETSTTVTDTKPAGGGAKSYDPETYTGNIPEAVKKTLDYFKQQAISQKPQSGGETAHTDDNAEADPTIGGRISNLVAQQGNLGLLGNPGSANSQTGPNGGQGVGSSQSGGDVDFGPDSDQVGYKGPTHQDDPADVQLGPAEQPKEQTDAKESNDTDDSSASNLDPLRKNRRDN